MRKSFALLVISMLVLSSCAKKVDVAAESTALLKVDADWAATIATKDPVAFTSFFTEDAVLMAPNMPVILGTDAINDWATQNMSLPGFNVVWTPTAADVADSGDMGYTLGTFVFQIGMPDGSTLTDNGKYATIWEKQADGTWKVAVDTFNSDISMMPAPSDSTGAMGQ